MNVSRSVKSGIRWIALLACLFPFVGTARGADAGSAPVVFKAVAGLEQRLVESIVQDGQGFLWVATNDGLYRYDGYDFTAFRNDPRNPASLPFNDVPVLHIDRAGVLWVGTQGGGLCRYDRDSETFATFKHDPNNPKSLPDNEIRALCEDASGALWVGTRTGGLCRFNAGTNDFVTFRNDPNDPNSLPGNDVRALATDRDGVLWIGMKGGGLARWDAVGRRFIAYKNDPTNPRALASDDVRALYVDSSNTLWVGTFGGGIRRHDRTTDDFTVYRKDAENPNGLNSGIVFAFLEDRAGDFWVGTRLGGLCLFDRRTERFRTFKADLPRNGGLTVNSAEALFEDRSGILWVGTGEGLFRYDRQATRFATYSMDELKAEGIDADLVLSMLEDASGNPWVGTSDGLFQWDRRAGVARRIESVPRVDPNGKREVVITLLTDRRGVLWLGMGRGLGRYDPRSGAFEYFHFDSPTAAITSNANVQALCEDASGTIWSGTRGGELIGFDPEEKRISMRGSGGRFAEVFGGYPIRAIVADADGGLWIGTRGAGLSRFDPATETFTTYRNDPANPRSLNNNAVLSLHEDKVGNLWVGTFGGGLSRFDRGTGVFHAFREGDGLGNDTVNRILEDAQGNLWLATNDGVSKYSPKTNMFRAYDSSDGLSEGKFSGGGCVTKDGWMFLCNKGLTAFSPERIVDNPYVPPVVLTNFRKFNRPFALGRSIATAETVDLSYRDNFITFEFAALNFTNPHKNRYAYKLEGFNRDWIQAGNQRFAVYTNLDPGEYVFRVKACNNDGLWNERGVAVKVSVAPPWWKTRWANALFAFVAAGTIYGGVRLRLRSLEARNRTLEAKVAERTAELDRKNTQLGETVNQLRLAKKETERKNVELDRKIMELVLSQRQADRIFSALAEALPGTVLEGKYRLGEKIGAGGFGAVFRGTHLTLDRPIAVKVFRPAPGNDSAEAVERFRLEGVSAARLNHPNVVAVLDSGVSADGIAYLVMELLRGRSLSEELRTCADISLRRCAWIVMSVCRALDEAHTAGIVHRDIKPENVFLHQSPDGEIVKVVDFGIAKTVGDEGAELVNNKLTMTGNLVGTPTYMSPERLRNRPYDGRSDIYALGVLFYEMVCGRAPFSGKTNTVLDVIMGHLESPPPPMCSVNPDVPPEVEAVVLRMLAKEPERRPTAAQVLDDLSRLPSRVLDLTVSRMSDAVSEDVSDLPTQTKMQISMKTPLIKVPTTIRDADEPTAESVLPRNLTSEDLN